jgi:putative ABC transport system permease protein
VVRSDRSIEELAGALREAVRALDPGEPLPEIATLASLLSDATARRRLEAGLYSGFALLALVLAMLGIYGVVAHAVSRRRREIGVRMALGAAERDVLYQMARLGVRWIAPGLLLGALGAWLAGRAMASQLFGIEPGSILHVALAALLLGAIALVACVVPARRAARIDPTITLRTP